MHRRHRARPTAPLIALALALTAYLIAPPPAHADPPLDPPESILALPPIASICAGDVDVSWTLSSAPAAMWRGRVVLGGPEGRSGTGQTLDLSAASGAATWPADAFAGIERLTIAFDRVGPEPEFGGLEDLDLSLTLRCAAPAFTLEAHCGRDNPCQGTAQVVLPTRVPGRRPELHRMSLDGCSGGDDAKLEVRGEPPRTPFGPTFLGCMAREVMAEASSRLTELCDAGVCSGDLARVERELRRRRDTRWTLTAVEASVESKRWWGRAQASQVAHFEMGSRLRTATVQCDRGPEDGFAKRKTCTLEARVGPHVIRYRRGLTSNRFAWAGMTIDPEVDYLEPERVGWVLHSADLERR